MPVAPLLSCVVVIAPVNVCRVALQCHAKEAPGRAIIIRIGDWNHGTFPVVGAGNTFAVIVHERKGFHIQVGHIHTFAIGAVGDNGVKAKIIATPTK